MTRSTISKKIQGRAKTKKGTKTGTAQRIQYIERGKIGSDQQKIGYHRTGAMQCFGSFGKQQIKSKFR